MSRRTKKGHAQKNETPKLRQQPGSQSKAKGQTKATRSHSGIATADSRSEVAAKEKERERSRLSWKRAELEPTSAWKARRLELVRRNHPGSSSETQRQRILMALALVRNVTTLECRKYLDIPAPAARICELRDDGKSIQAVLVWQETAPGCRHRFAKYLLEREEVR